MRKGWNLPKDQEKPLSSPTQQPPASPLKKAVALAYEPNLADAPRVTASGQGLIAERILEIAKANGVSVRQDADLMSVLSAVEVNSTIPLEAFAAVAEILSYVYRSTDRPLPQSASQSKEGTP